MNIEQEIEEVASKIIKTSDFDNPDTTLFSLREKTYKELFPKFFDKPITYTNPFLEKAGGTIVSIVNPRLGSFKIKTNKQAMMGDIPMKTEGIQYYGRDFIFKSDPQEVKIDVDAMEKIVEKNPYYKENFLLLKKALDKGIPNEFELVFFRNHGMKETGVRRKGTDGLGISIPFEALINPKTGNPLQESEVTCSFMDYDTFLKVADGVMEKIEMAYEITHDMSKNEGIKSSFEKDADISESTGLRP